MEILEPDLVITHLVMTSDGKFIITRTKYWLLGDMILSERETLIAL